MNKWNDFFKRVKIEYKKLIDDTFFEKEDLKVSAIHISNGILERSINKRIELLKDINNKVIEQSKIEMNHHLDQHNLYKKIIERYENN